MFRRPMWRNSSNTSAAVHSFWIGYGWALVLDRILHKLLFATEVGIGLGGAGGKGDVYIINKQTCEPELTRQSTMGQISFGFQFGSQVYSDIIFLENRTRLQA